LPSLPKKPEWARMAEIPAPSMYDLAMAPECGVTVASIKERWSTWGILGISRPRKFALVNCPLHDDQHASMAVYHDGGIYCYGCGFHGDVIDLYAATHGMTLREAIRDMAVGGGCRKPL